METVFRANHKSPVAVFCVSVPNLPHITDEFLERKMFPSAWGKNVSLFGVTRANGHIRFMILWANSGGQVVEYDVRRGIGRLGLGDRLSEASVTTEAALASLGKGHTTGSPRAGMPYTRNDKSDKGVVTAR